MTVTADIGGSSGSVFDWDIQYDDTTRAVTTQATGIGFCLVTVQITAAITRTVAYAQAGTSPQNAEFASRLAAADFHVVPNGQIVTLTSGINPNQVSRIVGKTGQVVGGLPSSAEWRGQ